MARSNRHSRAIGAIDRRGVAIAMLAHTWRPSTATSLTSGAYSIALRCTFSIISSSAMLTTNSPVAWMLRPVSFSTPALRPTLMPTIGGAFETKVNAENGARFTCPPGDTVVTHAMGRGTTMPVINL